jgi:hypothetical protein
MGFKLSASMLSAVYLQGWEAVRSGIKPQWEQISISATSGLYYNDAEKIECHPKGE